MDRIDYFRRQLSNDAWANHEVAAALKSCRTPLSHAERLLNHIVAAERLWLARIEGSASPLAVWPDLSLADCELQIAVSHQNLQNYFVRALPAALDRLVRYQNSKGESYESRVEDILAHVFLHSAYHRGQIALLMRQAGHTPAYTDFIHGIRQGFVE